MNAQLPAWCEESMRFPDAASYRLYERAKRDQWRIDTEIDWSRLRLSALAPIVRRSMANLYAQLQYGEMFALTQTARAVALSPYPWSRLIGATQVVDEARHVEFFSRVVVELGYAGDVDAGLVAFCEEVGASSSAEEAFLGTQILLESFAQSIFIEGTALARRAAGRAVRLPEAEAALGLLEALGKYIGRDEARHVAFGVIYLRERWRELAPEARAGLRRCAERWSQMLYGQIDKLAREMKVFGIDPAELRTRVERTRDAHFRDIGLT